MIKSNFNHAYTRLDMIKEQVEIPTIKILNNSSLVSITPLLVDMLKNENSAGSLEFNDKSNSEDI